MKRKCLVLDTCVAKSAGENTRYAKACRSFLRTVELKGYHFVLTKELEDEWDRNQSSYARKWRQRMTSRDRVRRVKLDDNSPLLNRLQHFAHRRKAEERRAILKDIHLVVAAIRIDESKEDEGDIIISDDETVRSLFCAACNVVHACCPIVWVNLDKPEGTSDSWRLDEDEAARWLDEGSPARAELTLGYRVQTQS